MNAYKEITELFYNEYTKEVQRKKDKINVKVENDNCEIVNSFDLFGPKMQMIISDQNLIAQYEGLQCLYAYIKFAPDIKEIIF